MSSFDDYADFDELEDRDDVVELGGGESRLASIDPESAGWRLEDAEDGTGTSLTVTVECRPMVVDEEASGADLDVPAEEVAELVIERIPFPGSAWDDVAELGGSWSGWGEPVRALIRHEGEEWRMASVDLEVADYQEGELSLQITLGEDLDGLGFDTLELGVDADFELYRFHRDGPLLDTAGLERGAHDKTFQLP